MAASYNYASDPDFLSASEAEKHDYLMRYEPQYQSAPLEMQREYLSQVAPKPVDPVTASREKLRKGFSEGRARSVEFAGQVAGPGAATVADILTPGSVPELGAELATMGSGALVNRFLQGGKLAARGGRALLRGPVAGAAGAGAGAALTGEDVGPEMAFGGVAGGAGETLGALGGFIGRHTPGRAAREARRYQKQLGEAVKDLVPEFGTVKTGDDFLDLVTDARNITRTGKQKPGKQKLGQMLDDADKEIRRKIKGEMLRVPVSGEETTLAARTRRLPGELEPPVATLGRRQGVMRGDFTGQLTYTQADARLKSLYRKSYTADAVKDTESAMKFREEAAVLRRAITDELERIGGRDVASTYDISRQKFDRGLEMMREIRKSMRPSLEGPVVDEAALQTEAFNRTLLGKVQNFQRDMGALDKWHEAVTRGTKIGRVSEITKGGSVSPSLYTGPGGRVSSFLNVGRALKADKYVGEREKGSLTRSFLDVATQRGVGKARSKKEE